MPVGRLKEFYRIDFRSGLISFRVYPNYFLRDNQESISSDGEFNNYTAHIIIWESSILFIKNSLCRLQAIYQNVIFPANPA